MLANICIFPQRLQGAVVDLHLHYCCTQHLNFEKKNYKIPINTYDFHM